MQDNGTNINFYYENFCSGSKIDQDFRIEVSEDEDAIQVLNKLNVPYTYEVFADEPIFDNKRQIFVRLYLPGLMTTGRYVYNTQNAQEAHRMALKDALHFIPNIVWTKSTNANNSTIKPVELTPPPEKNYVQPAPPEPMSQEKILEYFKQTAVTVEKPVDKDVTTAKEMNNDNREEIPYNNVKLTSEELQKLILGEDIPIDAKINNPESFSSTPVIDKGKELAFPEEEPEPDLDAIQTPIFKRPDTLPPLPPNPTNFTKDQIERMQEFKRVYHIDSDELFGKYVNSWNKKLTSKKDITPENIEEFLEYIDSLGKFPG